MYTKRSLLTLTLAICALVLTAVYGPGLLRSVDEMIYNVFAGKDGKPIRLLTPGEQTRMQKVLTSYRMPHYPEVVYVCWDTDSEWGSEEASRAKMQELATILHCLATRYATEWVGLSSPLTWQDRKDEMARVMLDGALREVKRVIVGVRGYNAAQAHDTPVEMREGAFPTERVEGDTSQLPMANCERSFELPGEEEGVYVVVPDFVEDELLTKWEAEQRNLSVPLLVKWNDRVWPTLALRLAMEQMGLSVQDVLARPGKSIRLGKRVLPLDEHGRTPLGSARARSLSLNELLSPDRKEEGRERGERSAIVLRPQLHSGEERARALAGTVSLLLAEERVVYLPGMRPERAQILELNPLQRTVIGRVILGAILLLCLLGLPRLPQLFPGLLRGTLLLAGLAGFWLLSWLWFREGMWMSLCTWVFCWLELLAYQWRVSRRTD